MNGFEIMEMIVGNIVRILLIFLTAGLVTGEASATADDKVTNEAIAALIEQLVLTGKDTYVMDGQPYLRREATARINQASEVLTAAGKDTWPHLFAHLQDKRPSTPSASTIGPHDVGEKCYFILRAQVMDFPEGYPYQKTLASDHISFRPGIAAWLTRRKTTPSMRSGTKCSAF